MVLVESARAEVTILMHRAMKLVLFAAEVSTDHP